MILSVDEKLQDAEWGSIPENCKACADDEFCGKQVCVAMNNLATTYANICEFYKEKGNAKDVVTAHVGIGGCSQLFSEEGNY